jgi:hypothetical protein
MSIIIIIIIIKIKLIVKINKNNKLINKKLKELELATNFLIFEIPNKGK